ncbi:LysR family transcriptional regulator [Naumannella cuiyingiana]|uniref:LysR family transcriptional activator of mexEF-oprN operon n=1 Tax=Naumannella cuiyingiana TaxID=1347891 RepID=A0A7Z0D7C4_9ACTN|nr:LysR family transcriptional regulator [Naumannella cuiyingiana]NYI70209.1 LysR family transcriptional activator of mexEF-oprN operon [Naumannella cuiyingiana]
MRRVDLNLLVVFHVLMRERHVTRAAATLQISQGAVSAALGRLRRTFDDDLFVRTRSGMQPTPRALELASRIGQPLGQIAGALFGDEVFEPQASRRTMIIALSDDLEAWLAPRLLAAAGQRQWSVRFTFRQTNSHLWRDALANPRVDAVICADPGSVPAAYQRRPLFSGSYSCLYDGARLGISTPLSLRDYVSLRHVRISYDAQRGFVDDLLDAMGHERPAIGSFTHFAGVLTSLRRTPTVATLPSFAAHEFAHAAGLTVSPPPMPMPSFAITLLWRVADEGDPAHRWLRDLIASIPWPGA